MLASQRDAPRSGPADETVQPAPSAPEGLDEDEARRRLAAFGPNALDRRHRRSLFDILRGILREPMFLLLLAAAGLYLLLGDLGEGLFMAGSAIVTIGLVVIQESRSERALDALRELAEPFARVIRSGVERRIPARELVPGDCILIGEGERLPADGLLLAGDALTVDESALTGESVPVIKHPARHEQATADDDPDPGGDGMPYLFAGTLNVRGQGVAHVTRTGAATRLGRIGASLAALPYEPSRLQQATASLTGKLGILALAFCVLIAVIYGLLRHDWVGGALSGITLAIALLPEEFPMVLAIFMALGAFRLARHKVLVRRAAVIETLGAATFLCVDKTGTLTENRMVLAATWQNGSLRHPLGDADLGEVRNLLQAARRASAVRPVDPMDRAVHEAAAPLAGEQADHAGPLQTYPLRPDLLAFVQSWPAAEEGHIYAAKGAPEAVFRLCRMEPEEHEAMDRAVVAMAQRGLRVLGVASGRSDDGMASPEALAFRFEGLIGFSDPVRSDVPQAIAQARRAGIAVMMITGDYPVTALEIARQAGIETNAGFLTGRDITTLTPDALKARVRQVRVFARIMPEQKLALVNALRANGEVVAMTGDGINDAPALKAASIGIAMGRRGTDVARESADIVLLDDRFASIIAGIRLGRRIFANLRKALTFVTAIHVPIAGIALLPLVMGLPPLLYPMHVVLLELVIDPVCSLVFEGEPGEPQAMERPPRPITEALFGTSQIVLGFVQGAGVLAAVFGLYTWSLHNGIAENEARAAAFVALVLGNLVLALADSAEPGIALFHRGRFAFWSITGTAVLILAATLIVPPLPRILQVEIPPPGLLVAAVAAAMAAGGWFGIIRRLRGNATPPPTPHTR